MLHRVGAGLIVAASLAALLAACAVPAKAPVRYVAPPAGPTARLVMRAAMSAGDVYGVHVMGDTERCGDRRLVGTGGPERNPATTTLAANQVQTVEFLVVKPNKNVCAVRWSFTPLAGKRYLLAGSAQATGCSARVMDMSDPDNLRPEPTALRRNLGNEACVPLARAKAAGATNEQHGGDAVLRPGASDDDLSGLIKP